MKENSLKSKAFQYAKENYFNLLPITLLMVTVAVVILALGVFFPSSLALTVGLILIPFYLSYSMSISYSFKKDGLEPSPGPLIKGYVAYFHLPYNGSYRYIRNLLFSFLIGAGVAFTFFVLYFSIGASLNPSWLEAMKNFYNDMINAASTEEALSVETAFLNLEFVSWGYNIGEFLSFSITMLLLTHQISHYSLAPYLRDSNIFGSPRLANQSFVALTRKKEYGFRKEYWGALWPFYLILFVLFLGGAAIGFFFFPDHLAFESSGPSWAACGFALALIGYMFMLPYHSYLMHFMDEKYSARYADYMLSSAKAALAKLESQAAVSQEQAEKIREDLRIAESIQKEKNEGKDLLEAVEDHKDDVSEKEDSSLSDYGSSDHHEE